MSAQTSPRPTIALLIPTLNEIAGLRATIPFIDLSLFDEIIVVDGGSRDGSVEYALEKGLKVVKQTRLGLQNAIYDAVMALTSDYIVEFSPDGNCKPDLLPELVAKLREGYDMVVVSRYLGHAQSHDDHLVSAFGNWFFTLLMKPLSRFPITDSLTIYRGYKRSIVLDPDFLPCLKGPVLEPLVTGICALRNLQVAEIPGDEPKRIGGETKRGIFYNGLVVLLMIARMYAIKFFGLRL
ncbi:MAG: glycosyltransferase family 2 protein [Gammaproteobacteria bacterium]|nr:glycosyltransferase family 2 protein [Gammaproteobacteria bacterium]